MAESTTHVTGTAAKSHASIQVHHPARTSFSGVQWLDFLFEDFEFYRYGIISILLLVFGTLAGAAVGLGAMSSPVEIALLIIPTMAALTMILAVAPMRTLIWTCLFAIAIDVIMIIYHLVV
ncbi:MAG: hypothetical protein H6582_08150 [Crocinitomicaceae bacterium]|nr:hypothetical protein [Crocinitomicaceae bacterium]